MGAKNYDILLVHSHFRAHEYYLNICKHLGGKLRVGVYVRPPEERAGPHVKALGKLEATDQLYLDKCAEVGGEIVTDERASCSLLVFPQKALVPEYIQAVSERVTRKRTIAVQSFAMGTQLLREISEAGAEKLLLWDRNIFANKLFTPEDEALAGRFELVDSGSPYQRYPVFEDMGIDYMIALPTTLLVSDFHYRLRILENALSLVRGIGPEKRICIKLHNVRDGGNDLFFGGRGVEQTLGAAAKALTGLAKGARSLFGGGRVSNRLHLAASRAVWSILERACQPLSELTPCHNFGVEHFLPRVSLGLITGISASSWYALHDRLPVYNCDEQPFDPETFVNAHTYRSFYVPSCRGRLEFDPANFDLVPEASRKGDLLQLLADEAC